MLLLCFAHRFFISAAVVVRRVSFKAVWMSARQFALGRDTRAPEGSVRRQDKQRDSVFNVNLGITEQLFSPGRLGFSTFQSSKALSMCKYGHISVPKPCVEKSYLS